MVSKIKTVEGGPSDEAVELLERIETQREAVAVLQRRYDLMKEQAKDAKAELDGGLEKLLALCAARSEDHPLLDDDN